MNGHIRITCALSGMLAIAILGKPLLGAEVLGCFRRDPTSGKIEYVATLTDRNTPAVELAGANAVAFSPDGNYLYLAAQHGRSVSIFRHDAPEVRDAVSHPHEEAAQVLDVPSFQRYLISQSDEFTLLIDTATGRTWRLTLTEKDDGSTAYVWVPVKTLDE